MGEEAKVGRCLVVGRTGAGVGLRLRGSKCSCKLGQDRLRGRPVCAGGRAARGPGGGRRWIAGCAGWRWTW